MTESRSDMPAARDLGLVPGLTPGQLRRVYRQLARRYHPDSGQQGSEEIMRRINAAHDELRAGMRPEARLTPLGDDLSPEPTRAMHGAADPAPAEGPEGRAPPDPEASFGELALTEQAREMMSEALLAAVDAWLVRSRGLPRNTLRRRMLLRMGRIGPLDCPGLHMPERISMTRAALRFHFLTEPVTGLNLVALPALANRGLLLAPTGAVAVLEALFGAGQVDYKVAPEDARAKGFALALDGRALPVRLVFDGGTGNYAQSLYRLPDRRFRGLFAPSIPPP